MTLDGQVLGTIAYMRVQSNSALPTESTAVAISTALASCFYQLLTRELPFRGDARMVQIQVLEDDPSPPRRLDSTGSPAAIWRQSPSNAWRSSRHSGIYRPGSWRWTSAISWLASRSSPGRPVTGSGSGGGAGANQAWLPWRGAWA